MLAAVFYPITIAEMATYMKDAARIFDDDDHDGLKEFLAFHPEAGDVIPGTGGVRKLRWPIKNRGKSHGARIIYFFHDLNMPLYMLAVYTKGENIKLDAGSRNEMKRRVEKLVAKHSERWARIVATNTENGAQ